MENRDCTEYKSWPPLQLKTNKKPWNRVRNNPKNKEHRNKTWNKKTQHIHIWVLFWCVHSHSFNLCFNVFLIGLRSLFWVLFRQSLHTKNSPRNTQKTPNDHIADWSQQLYTWTQPQYVRFNLVDKGLAGCNPFQLFRNSSWARN